MFLQHFNFTGLWSLRNVKMSLKFESAYCSRKSNNVLAQFSTYASETLLEGLSSVASSGNNFRHDFRKVKFGISSQLFEHEKTVSLIVHFL